MASRVNSPSTSRDRLSDLPEGVLGHILSFLPNTEAGRAAVLGRRWRYVFGNVHTVSFEEYEGQREGDWITFYYEAEERKSCSKALLDNISAALLCRLRCAGHHAPLRNFHFAFDKYHWWDGDFVNQWLTYVLRQSKQELHLDLSFCIGPIHGSDNSDDDDDMEEEKEVDSASDDDDKPLRDRWTYVLPRRLFSCIALRTLCVSYCRLKLPEAVNLPFLETLRLTGLHHDSGGSIQRLISSCPRLTDLTLEALRHLKRVSVLDKRLRRFALRCCHSVENVSIDASELTCLDYMGAVPAESLLSLHCSREILSCTIGLCKGLSKEEKFDGFRKFLVKFSDSKHLHLHHRSLESKFFAIPSFSSLRRLVLQGCLQSCNIVDAVRRILEQTPNLEVFSLYMEVPKYNPRMFDRNGQPFVPEVLAIPDVSSFSIPCLRRRVKEINMVCYQGNQAQRMLAYRLLHNALVLEMLCVVFPKGTLALQVQLKNEIESWAVANSEKIFL